MMVLIMVVLIKMRIIVSDYNDVAGSSDGGVGRDDSDDKDDEDGDCTDDFDITVI